MNNDDNKNNLNAITDFEKSGFSPEDFRAEDQQLLANDTAYEVNRFPIEVFPLAIQQIISATNEHLKYPIDFTAASMIFAVSVAIGNTHKVHVQTGWVETPVIWMALVGRVGTNKSHPLEFALAPILNDDKRSFAIYRKKHQEYEKAISLSKSERKELGIDDPVKPVREKYLLTDYTPEALALIHKFNLRGIGVYADELAGWFKNFGRYHKGSEVEFWLSCWSGKRINVDRKVGDEICIPSPYIPVGGTIQYEVLNDLYKVSRNHNGLIDRILFAVPENLSKQHWSTDEMDPKFIDQWREIAFKLLTIKIDFDEDLSPRYEAMHYTPKAKAMLEEWQGRNADECNNAETGAIRGAINKMEIHAIRMSLILQLMRWACNEDDKNTIGEEAVEGALQLAEYFKRAAIKVHSIIDNYSPLDDLPGNWRKLYEALPSTFTSAEGIELAEFHRIPEDTFNKWLGRQTKTLFKLLKRGHFEKIY